MKRVVLPCIAILAIVGLLIGGCQKDEEMLVGAYTNPAPAEAFPLALFGTWVAQSAVVDNQPCCLADVLDFASYPNCSTATILFTQSGAFVYRLTDSSGTTVFHVRGQAVVHENRITLRRDPFDSWFSMEPETEGAWALAEDRLTLTSYSAPISGFVSVTYTKQP